MKKFSAVFVAVMLCMVFSSCSADDSDKAYGVSQTAETDFSAAEEIYSNMPNIIVTGEFQGENGEAEYSEEQNDNGSAGGELVLTPMN